MTFRNLIFKFTSTAYNRTFKVPRSFEEKTMSYWKALLAVLFFMTILVLITSFFVHRDIWQGEFSPVTKAAVPGSSLVTSLHLEKLVSGFETKKVTFEQIRKNRTSIVDPSR